MRSSRSALLVATFALGGVWSRAEAQKVLLIADDDVAGSATLGSALTAAGMKVTQTGNPSWQYDGATPAPTGFDVIVLLSGGPSMNSQNVDMPQAGQTAIAKFVAGGGGLVNTEWSAFQVSKGNWQTLKPLVLLARTSGSIGTLDYTVAQGFANHPLWANLPGSFSFPSATNVGAMIPSPGVFRVATSMLGGDGVVARDLINTGRIVQISSAGNYNPGTFTHAQVQTLFANACQWASLSRKNSAPVANPGGPYVVDEGASIKLSGSCADVDQDLETLTWDFTGNGQFADGMGQTPTFSAANLSGPATVTVSLKCTDTGNLSGITTTTITIKNVAPKFTSQPPTVAVEGTAYQYAAMASDPGAGDVLTCSLVSGPMGMTVDGNSCAVAWLPTYDQVLGGLVKVTIRVTDKAGATSDQSWSIQASFLDADMDGLPDSWEKMYFHAICAGLMKDDLCEGAGDDPDMDGRPNLKELQDGTDPTSYDGPSAPALMAPKNASRTPLHPELVVANAMGLQGEKLTYEFEVYSEKALINIVDVEVGVAEGMGSTRYTVPTALTEDHHDFWRARARDSFAAGAWSATGTFFADAVHEPPTAPGISQPFDGGKINASHPMLIVTDAKSPDEYALTYDFEVYADAQLGKSVEAQTMLAEGMGSTACQAMAMLTDNTRYWWRARAVDEMGLAGPWSKVVSFLVVTMDSPPTEPVIAAPKNLSTIATLTPEVRLGGSIDPDEEVVTYQCDLDVRDTFDTPQKQSVSSLKLDLMTNASWTPPAPLKENQRFCLRCRAHDASATSGWAQACFFVDVKNDPPSVPTLGNPSNGGMAAGSAVRFTWTDSVDPESDDVRYELEVFRDAKLAERAAQTVAGDGQLGASMSGFTAGSYWWRARAVDVKGAASEWSMPNQFTLVDGASPTSPYGSAAIDGGCGCNLRGPRSSARAPIALWLGVAVLALRTRRRRFIA